MKEQFERAKTIQIRWHHRILETEHISKHYTTEPLQILSIQFHPTLSRIATSGGDNSAKIWDYDAYKVEFVADLPNPDNKSVNVVRWSPNGLYLAAGCDRGKILLWKQAENSEKNNEIWTICKILNALEQDVYDICWSPDSKYLVSGGKLNIDVTETESRKDKVILWDIVKGERIQTIADHTQTVQGVFWDPLGMFFVSQSSDGSCRVYSKKQQKKFTSIAIKLNTQNERLFRDEQMRGFFRRLAISPDGSILIAVAGQKKTKDGKIQNCAYVFARNHWKDPFTCIPTDLQPVVGVSFSPVLYKPRVGEKNGLLPKLNYRMIFALITVSSVIVYDTQRTAPLLFISDVHYGPLTDVSWRKDGLALFVSSMDGYCTVISFKENELGEPLNELPPHLAEYRKQIEKEQNEVQQELSKEEQVNILQVKKRDEK